VEVPADAKKYLFGFTDKQLSEEVFVRWLAVMTWLSSLGGAVLTVAGIICVLPDGSHNDAPRRIGGAAMLFGVVALVSYRVGCYVLYGQ